MDHEMTRPEYHQHSFSIAQVRDDEFVEIGVPFS